MRPAKCAGFPEFNASKSGRDRAADSGRARVSSVVVVVVVAVKAGS